MPRSGAALAVTLLLAAAMPAQASSAVVVGKSAYPNLQALKETEPPRQDEGEEGAGREAQGEAQRLAALSWATQAGLAHRGREIAALLDERAKHLSAVFDFGALLLERDGFLVMPPVLAETRDAIRITDGMAASARRVLRITDGERIVGAPPTWREWLEREWEPARQPSPVLFPRDEAERQRWEAWLEEGWKRGRPARERHLRIRTGAAGSGVRGGGAMAPASPGGNGRRARDAVREHTAVSGHERLMRVSESVVRLEGRAAFNLAPRDWEPVPEKVGGVGSPGERP